MNDRYILPLRTVEDLNQQWLEEVLCYGLNTDVSLRSWEVKKPEKKVGIASEICFVRVSFMTQTMEKEREVWKRSLVVKMYPEDEEKMRSMQAERFGEREVQFYKYVATKEFKNFCQKSGIPKPAPQAYWAGMEGDALTVVLPDLLTDGYKMVLSPEGIKLAEVKIILRSIATIHAAGFARIEKYGKCPCDIPWDNNFQGEQVQNGIDMLIPLFDNKPMADVLKTLRQQIPLLLLFCMKDSCLKTLIHGDLWIGNIMFSADGKLACIIDWQFTRIGNPVCDILTLLVLSADPSVYSSHLSEVLECYWKTFENALTQNGVGSNLNVSLQNLAMNVDDMWLYGFMFFCAAYSHLTSFNIMSQRRGKAVISFLEKHGVFDKFLECKK